MSLKTKYSHDDTVIEIGIDEAGEVHYLVEYMYQL